MNIVILSREYPPDTHWGGCATVNYNLACALAERGHNVQVICQAVGRPRSYPDRGVLVHRVGTNPSRYSAIARLNYYFHAWRKLRELTGQVRVDVIQTDYWSAEGFFPSILKEGALVVAAQSLPEDAIKTGTYRGLTQLVQLQLLGLLADLTAHRADSIIVNSTNHANRLATKHLGAAKVESIPLAIDTAQFSCPTVDSRQQLGIASHQPLILFVGRLEPKKGAHILFQALAEVLAGCPAARVLLVGRDTLAGPGGSSFKHYLLSEVLPSEYAGHVTFLESVPYNEMVNIYSACDVFVLPSLEESFGLVLLEAMACGKPVVATATGIAPELGLDGSNGVLVPINNAGALAEGIIHCLSLTPGQKESVALQNRKKVEQEFSIAEWVEKWEGVYRQVADRHKEGVR
ncbi:MAG: glycosyltransferase family 4 protein [Chloroflexota bacterium]|nr:glycosyltransferase family 4 protein [Chloroflexota bacterium]